eukprot:1159009-Pelagomonas_calceolata.AAC.2
MAAADRGGASTDSPGAWSIIIAALSSVWSRTWAVCGAAACGSAGAQACHEGRQFNMIDQTMSSNVIDQVMESRGNDPPGDHDESNKSTDKMMMERQAHATWPMLFMVKWWAFQLGSLLHTSASFIVARCRTTGLRTHGLDEHFKWVTAKHKWIILHYYYSVALLLVHYMAAAIASQNKGCSSFNEGIHAMPK